MKLFVFFGLPGTGKTYCSKIAEKYFGYHLYDGDNDLTPEMQKAIKTQTVITDDMRDVFFENLINSTKALLNRYEKLIIHQTFIKDKYRGQFLSEIPEANFVLIETDLTIREKRLKERKEYPLDEEYAKKMTKIFEKPNITYVKIINNSDGGGSIKEQLRKILLS
jgi:gluconate kinase